VSNVERSRVLRAFAPRRFVIGLLSAVLAITLSQLILAGLGLLRVEERPRNPIGIPSPPVDAAVYFAPVGNYPTNEVDLLVRHYREKFGLEIGVLPTVHVSADAFDRTREQLVAEGVIDALSRTDAAVKDPSAIVIGLVRADMYIAGRDWRYAYSLRGDDRYAVISTARMGDGLFVDAARRLRRIQKMVTKNLGILYYGLPQSDDPGSVLYRNILGPTDLDRASEDF
jgi:predicted Zn-dependent protease